MPSHASRMCNQINCALMSELEPQVDSWLSATSQPRLPQRQRDIHYIGTSAGMDMQNLRRYWPQPCKAYRVRG